MKCLALLVLYLYSNITFAHIRKLVTSPGSVWSARPCAQICWDILNAGGIASPLRSSKQQ